jgi:hypothetical protein
MRDPKDDYTQLTSSRNNSVSSSQSNQRVATTEAFQQSGVLVSEDVFWNDGVGFIMAEVEANSASTRSHQSGAKVAVG